MSKVEMILELAAHIGRLDDQIYGDGRKLKLYNSAPYWRHRLPEKAVALVSRSYDGSISIVSQRNGVPGYLKKLKGKEFANGPMLKKAVRREAFLDYAKNGVISN